MHSPAMLLEDFQLRLKSIVPADHWQQIWQSFNDEKPLVIRVNTLKTTIDKLAENLRSNHIAFHKIDWKPDCFVIQPTQRRLTIDSNAYNHGFMYSQNLSSQLAPMILDPQQGEEILDLCAAPGGKTTQIACTICDNGRIAAVESVKSRFFKLKANLKTQGVNCVKVYLGDGRKVWRKTPERFDRVLLDAPCSSESRIRFNDPKTYQYWRIKKVKEMAKKQRQLIYSAFQCLKPGGILVYSTCSFSPEENEQVINHLIKKFDPQVKIEAITLPIKNVQAGITNWQTKNYHPDVNKAMRILPNELMDGFFLCRIKKVHTNCIYVG